MHSNKLPSNVLDYVLEIKQAFNEPLLNLINEEIYKKNNHFFSVGLVGNTDSRTDQRVRSVEVMGFQEKDIGSSVSLRVLYNKIRLINNIILKHYTDTVSEFLLQPTEVTLQFLRYTDKMNGHYESHTDNSYLNPRQTTTIIGLSNPNTYEGGELSIQNSDKKIKLELGGGVIFPSNFMYPHKVFPVTKGERRVLVIWNR